MKTKKIQMRVFQEFLLCEKCQMVMEQMTGVLSRDNIYVCPNCGHRETTSEQYPRIIYEPVVKVGNFEK